MATASSSAGRRPAPARRSEQPTPPESAAADRSPSALISERIAELGGWRGALLARLREIVTAADPAITEEWKWRGTPVWYREGPVCTGESYKSVVKMTFARGASLSDPAGLFNASLEGKVRRAIDFRETDAVDAAALARLVREAVAANVESRKKKK